MGTNNSSAAARSSFTEKGQGARPRLIKCARPSVSRGPCDHGDSSRRSTRHNRIPRIPLIAINMHVLFFFLIFYNEKHFIFRAQERGNWMSPNRRPHNNLIVFKFCSKKKSKVGWKNLLKNWNTTSMKFILQIIIYCLFLDYHKKIFLSTYNVKNLMYLWSYLKAVSAPSIYINLIDY